MGWQASYFFFPNKDKVAIVLKNFCQYYNLDVFSLLNYSIRLIQMLNKHDFSHRGVLDTIPFFIFRLLRSIKVCTIYGIYYMEELTCFKDMC